MILYAKLIEDIGTDEADNIQRLDSGRWTLPAVSIGNLLHARISCAKYLCCVIITSLMTYFKYLEISARVI